MSPVYQVGFIVTINILGLCVGWAVCWELCKSRLTEYWDEMELARDELEETEQLLRDICLAAIPIVHRMKAAIEVDDCEDAMETTRQFEWHEIEPLAKCLNEVREVYGEDI